MSTTDDNRHDDDIDDLLTLHEVAELLRVPDATLRYWRHCTPDPTATRSAATSATRAARSTRGCVASAARGGPGDA